MRLRMLPTGSRGTVFVAALFLSCVNTSFPRETTANNARTDDTWLEGDRCGDGPRDDTGLRIETLEAGTGTVASLGHTVRVHYVAQLPDGTKVHDTSADGPPIELIVGSSRVICGFERGIVGMHAGEQRRVTVPWRLAFGEEGKPPGVPPRTDVVFVIDLFTPADPVLEQRGGGGAAPAQRGAGGRGPGGH
jgi:FKBP-type peptidyl-prolyl cis-trans isomerase